MYPGYFGGMHPDFMKWLRHRSKWNQLWCQFEAAPAVTGLNIGSVGSLHNGEELAQHPVCVQSRDLFKSFMCRVDQNIKSSFPVVLRKFAGVFGSSCKIWTKTCFEILG